MSQEKVIERSDVEVMPYRDMGQCVSEWKCSVAGFLIGYRENTSSVGLKWGQRARKNDDSVAFPSQIKLEVFYINPITLLAIMPQCTKKPGKEFHVL